MTLADGAGTKLTAGHLSRAAYLYVRQSTLRQVIEIENTTSTERQYGRCANEPSGLELGAVHRPRKSLVAASGQQRRRLDRQLPDLLYGLLVDRLLRHGHGHKLRSPG